MRGKERKKEHRGLSIVCTGIVAQVTSKRSAALAAAAAITTTEKASKPHTYKYIHTQAENEQKSNIKSRRRYMFYILIVLYIY